MILNRRTFQAKPGKELAVAELLKSGGNYMENVPPFRVSWTKFGQGNRVALEGEFEDLAAHEEFWSRFEAAPETPDLLAQFHELIEAEWTNEIWVVH